MLLGGSLGILFASGVQVEIKRVSACRRGSGTAFAASPFDVSRVAKRPPTGVPRNSLVMLAPLSADRI